ncbi:hypothetical protein PENANT_c004G10089 [Penicillium antarcticum]|uniref:ceramidase n=1 Tax=Penicillium antarcticum TaxID=416450 RepID=A0A1V6QFX0_9EURO|nr:uncharacterized protein N7508_002498 [Penicillium antarcticum]KAJ5317990.1 hypothetical protein N7508_002498 [Penicillium antarcticum]OQD88108.1 hypothetical protein PENANT_c004G10089 [Penicillium antarcticum]
MSFLHDPPRGQPVPVFRINLSLPPEERYVSLARLYKEKARAMTGIFDDVIHEISPKIPTSLVHWLAWLFLRGLYTSEETAEIRGISHETGIDLYLLVSLNVVLDLLMGCTSGGVRVGDGADTKMVHFRTLDWGMDPLRDLVVQLEFIKEEAPDKVLATSITYVGFVGILTGVRKNLSASLNMRAVHDSRRNTAFYFNHLLVLLGVRQSISSLLRQIILPGPDKPHDQLSNASTIDEIIAKVPGISTTAAYLIFCDGTTSLTLEKDLGSAVIRSSNSFVITTNHDQESNFTTTEVTEDEGGHTGLRLAGAEQTIGEFIDESKTRQACMQKKWDRQVQKQNSTQQGLKKRVNRDKAPDRKAHSMQLRQRQDMPSGTEPSPEPEISITQDTALRWLWSYPIVNEDTHYAVLMDPVEGSFIYTGLFPVLREGDDREEN